MVTIRRTSDTPYTVSYGSAPLERVANIERHLPDAFIADDRPRPDARLSAYALPLLGDAIAPV